MRVLQKGVEPTTKTVKRVKIDLMEGAVVGIGETLNFFHNNTCSILPPQILFINHSPHSSSYPRILASKEKHLETRIEYRDYVFGTNREKFGRNRTWSRINTRRYWDPVYGTKASRDSTRSRPKFSDPYRSSGSRVTWRCYTFLSASNTIYHLDRDKTS